MCGVYRTFTSSATSIACFAFTHRTTLHLPYSAPHRFMHRHKFSDLDAQLFRQKYTGAKSAHYIFSPPPPLLLSSERGSPIGEYLSVTLTNLFLYIYHG
ncbi:hypothetical protein POVWA2_059130 [Plasmodium ovale wallikeri]|uniref:Uncharacterized protein n=1 Tax=Plasmodium ovale wallikeri TaxID=864142 RepID=A0A1A9A153_PLAOA|nr:hypothetical protein POVWA2_059130 [Plasmodium ovale wallikeri]